MKRKIKHLVGKQYYADKTLPDRAKVNPKKKRKQPVTKRRHAIVELNPDTSFSEPHVYFIIEKDERQRTIKFLKENFTFTSNFNRVYFFQEKIKDKAFPSNKRNCEYFILKVPKYSWLKAPDKLNFLQKTFTKNAKKYRINFNKYGKTISKKKKSDTVPRKTIRVFRAKGS